MAIQQRVLAGGFPVSDLRSASSQNLHHLSSSFCHRPKARRKLYQEMTKCSWTNAGSSGRCRLMKLCWCSTPDPTPRRRPDPIVFKTTTTTTMIPVSSESANNALSTDRNESSLRRGFVGTMTILSPITIWPSSPSSQRRINNSSQKHLLHRLSIDFDIADKFSSRQMPCVARRCDVSVWRRLHADHTISIVSTTQCPIVSKIELKHAAAPCSRSATLN